MSGKLTLISSATASSSSSVEFTSGIDSTYDEYQFWCVNIHPVTGGGDHFEVNFSSDGGSNYNVTKTTTFFWAYHTEADASALAYNTGYDLAQSTSYQFLASSNSADADGGCSGVLHLFAPSSTTKVKNFYSRFATYTEYPADGIKDDYAAGYCNTTSAINAVSFKHSAGNTNAGTIYLFGVG